MSRTSTSSSTSDAAPAAPGQSPFRRLAGLARLTHPFPSILNGIATAAIALLAGAEPSTAARLAVAMTLLQFSIGSANDVIDADRDVGRADKPIPGGSVSRRVATVAAVGFAATGLILCVPFGPATFTVAAVGLAVGLAYDLGFRGTGASWVPFAVGVPLLPVFAWLGATGQLPGAFAVLVPAAVLAGSGLAIGNALADFDRDRLAGAGSIARSLGEGRAWWVHVGLLGLASAIAIGSIVLQEGGAAGPRPAQPGLAVALAGAGVVIAGAWFARRPRTAERGWEVEAVGLVVVAVGWMIGTDLRS